MSLSIDLLHCDVTFVYDYVCILPYGGHHFEWQNCIAVIERKVLIVLLFCSASDYSNKTCIFCKIRHIDLYMQVLLEYHLKPIQLAPISQSLQYISATQNGGQHTEVYGCIQIWHHNAKGLLQGDVDYSAIKNSSVAITLYNFCFLCSGSWHAKRRRKRLITHWWSSVQTCATTSNIMMKLTCGTGKCFNNSPRHTRQWEHTHVFTYCEDCWVQSCHCLFGKSIALLCPAHTCFEIDFVSISMAMILLIEQFFY